jgi:hypothetical protein
MSWNPFKSFLPKRSVSHPPKLSQCLEAVALLYITKAFPFSSWRDPNMRLTEDESSVFYKICTTMQFSSFQNALEKAIGDEILSNASTHSIFEIISRSEPELKKSLHFFFKLNGEFIIRLAKMNLSDEKSKSIHPRHWIAGMWIQMEQESAGGDFKLDQISLERLVKCVEFATNASASYFQNVCKNIAEFDTHNIVDLYFDDIHGLNEEVAYRKFEYQGVFQSENITLSDLIHAKKLDRAEFVKASVKNDEMRRNSRDIIMKFMSPGEDLETSYKALDGWLIEYDKLRAKLFVQDGECRFLLEEMNKFRGDIRSAIFEAAKAENEYQELLALCVELFDSGNNYYNELTKSKLGLQIGLIERNNDLAPFILTSSNSELIEFRDVFTKDENSITVLEKFVDDLFFKLSCSSLEEGAGKMKFLFDKLKIIKGSY